MKKLLLTPLLYFVSFITAHAGWYVCYNFEGTIGKHPIHLYLQIMGIHREGNDSVVKIEGLYKYDKYNEPIALTGTLNRGNHVVLKEIVNNQPNAVFDFVLSGPAVTGSWVLLKDMKLLPLQLNKTGELTDTLNESTAASVEILQSANFKDNYMVGVYSKAASEDRVQMDQLKILNKKTNAIVQVIDFSKVETTTGNVITIIYNNVEISDDNKDLQIWNSAGRMGSILHAHFNSATGKYQLNTKPVLDGPDS
ncbi:hypothetical protein SAMN05421788_11179 [Filimonas lacunae]|uniref:Uncharacterized protein n=1 Tax=Filimonas lacunae TaxID=477680 RepID=A0A1N7RB33_9BACT|nr:hypothetical protein [Filimonas lacunae]SIT32295.1 hypothetical protein SAMN05421788_11179 [Filimonas lacunae]